MEEELINKEVLAFYLQNRVGLIRGKGVSMLPCLKDNWKIKVAPVLSREIKVGDIVLLNGETLRIHRIIAKFSFKGRLFFVEKGDNLNNFSVVSDGQIIGKIEEVFDENSHLVEANQWNKRIPNSTYVLAICFVFKVLNFFKKLIFGRKTNKFTSKVGNLYWKVFLGQN